jgi:Lrp/AsnC family leucine-responsive transcriptional regulator
MELLTSVDAKVVRRLMEQGRITWAELAAELGVTPPAAADRVRRLEQRGIIKGYAALVDPETVGCHLTAFVSVALEKPRYRKPFLQLIHRMPEVMECHHVAGEDDYLVKVRCRDTRNLDDNVISRLKSLDGVARTRTTIILSTEKEGVHLPIRVDEG